jgi:uncharacterized protein (TIGR02594 family)
MRTLRAGDKGYEVRQLQLLLNQTRIPPQLPITGNFGTQTTAAVIAFQRNKRLDDDGVVGRNTWAALNVYAPTPPAPAPDLGGQGDWMAIARAEMNVAEIAGANHNARVLEYHATVRGHIRDDETPWCSSFVNWVLLQAGFQGTNNAAARSWLTWGTALTTPRAGAIVVTKMPVPDTQAGSRSGNHVAFYESSDDKTITMLGGNQSGKVMSKVRKRSDFTSVVYRWPSTIA